MKSPMSCKIRGENVSYFRLVLIHSNSCTFSWFWQNLKNVLKSWNFSCKKYFFKFSDFRPFLLQKYVTAQNLFWTTNVYLLVRQLPYTAKAKKSYDGNKNFQPARLVQRSHRALISIHGEPHFCAFAVYGNCLTNKYTFCIQIQKWMHKLHGCGLDQWNGSSLQQSKIILFNTTK